MITEIVTVMLEFVTGDPDRDWISRIGLLCEKIRLDFKFRVCMIGKLKYVFKDEGKEKLLV